MTSLLRVCSLISRKRCFQEFASQSRPITYFTRIPSNIKKFTSVLQVKYFSAENDMKLEKKLVYTGSLSHHFRNIKVFSFFTSFGSFVFQPILYQKALEDDSMLAFVGIIGVINFFAIGTPVLIHLIAKKYVTDLYYFPLEDKYLALRYSFFLRKKEIPFMVHDVHVPDVCGMFTTCFIKGNPLFFNEANFKDASHYYNIMGFYKPIDFKLDTNVNVNKIKTLKEDHGPLKIENKQ
ncbi:transmembrane protein 70 homolog, mitochondrial [Hylaeus anthracinus]|uniref:transmembrane protein 70 homolog, mitochondrial n=1 Tax=Hylaeus anthracinus TaxID=313031 RepID=UPI0023B8CCD1|nr:transmembrane protein 70 homolog, mitochondrial [Hylaeus anthracinus]